MPKKTQPQPQQEYKTETQLKEEARAKQIAESEAKSKIHKSEFQKKRENFWYHYKWHTLAAIAAALLLIFFVKDMFFRTKPDATIIVVSSGFISSEALESLTAALEEITTDFNGDGKIAISTDYITLPKLETEESVPAPDLTGGQQDMGNAMKLMTVIAASDDPVYLLDKNAYAYLSSIGQDDDPDLEYSIFEAFSVPVNKINYAGAAEFEGMDFYLRSSFSDENYYEYCKRLLQVIAEE